MGLDWPAAWDQGAWGTAMGVLGLASALWAAVASSFTRRRVREALEVQRVQRVRQRLISVADDVEAWAQHLDGPMLADDRESARAALQDWPFLLGEIEGLLISAPYLTPALVTEVQTALSDVDAKIELAEVALVREARPTAQATRSLRASVRNLRRLLRRIVSESRGDAPP